MQSIARDDERPAMKLHQRLIRFALAAACFGLIAQASATAASLAPGTVLFGPSTETDPVGGTVVATLSTPFTVPGSFSGTLTADVVSGDTSNPLGGLTFVYRLANDGVAGPNSIGRLSISEWTGFSLDGSYQTPVSAGDVAPATIDRNPSSDVVGFNFLPLPADPASGFLAPGTTSAALVIQTDASAYASGAFASMIDGGGITIATFAPVPEPSTVCLLLTGLAAGGLAVRRNR